VRAAAILVALGLFTACTAQEPTISKGSIEAGAQAAKRLQSLATQACECSRKARADMWEPWPYESDEVKESAPPKCWQQFARELEPYSYDVAPVAACGPGSDTSGVVLGRDRTFQGREGGWSVADENGKIIERHDSPKGRPLEIFEVQLHYGFGTCTPAQFTKAKADYEAKAKRPSCG
jgi:hypothetical protein